MMDLTNIMRREIGRFLLRWARVKHGEVTSYDPNTNSVKVTLQPEGIPSGWLPIMTVGASTKGISVQNGPSVGDLALIHHAEGDPEAAHVFGFLHSNVNRPPGAQSGQHIVKHNPTGVQRLLSELGHFISAPKLASSVISQTITHFAQDLIGDESAKILHTADNGIAHTANKGDIVHTAKKGSISHTASGQGNSISMSVPDQNSSISMSAPMPNSNISISAPNVNSSISMAATTVNVNGLINLNGLPVSATIAPCVVADLPASPIAVQGLRGMATDLTVTLPSGLGNTVVGLGANIVPVYYDGANWKIG